MCLETSPENPPLKEQLCFWFARGVSNGLPWWLRKNLPAMQEPQVRPLDWEDPLEEAMATHSSILAWKNPMDRGACWATVHGVAQSDTTEVT